MRGHKAIVCACRARERRHKSHKGCVPLYFFAASSPLKASWPHPLPALSLSLNRVWKRDCARCRRRFAPRRRRRPHIKAGRLQRRQHRPAVARFCKSMSVGHSSSTTASPIEGSQAHTAVQKCRNSDLRACLLALIQDARAVSGVHSNPFSPVAAVGRGN